MNLIDHHTQYVPLKKLSIISFADPFNCVGMTQRGVLFLRMLLKPAASTK